MRQRVEDLGRIAAMLKHILDSELFEDRPFRNKEFLDWLAEQSEEKRDDYLHALPYKIEHLQEKLYEILEIAEGTDPLNETVND
jgi:hypothetical protein